MDTSYVQVQRYYLLLGKMVNTYTPNPHYLGLNSCSTTYTGCFLTKAKLLNCSSTSIKKKKKRKSTQKTCIIGLLWGFNALKFTKYLKLCFAHSKHWRNIHNYYSDIPLYHNNNNEGTIIILILFIMKLWLKKIM